MSTPIARVYASLVEKKQKTIDEVPENLRVEVLVILIQKGVYTMDDVPENLKTEVLAALGNS